MTEKELKEFEMAMIDLGIKSKAQLARELGMGYDNVNKYLKVGAKKSYWVTAFMLAYKKSKNILP